MSNYCFTDVVEGNRYRVAKIVEKVLEKKNTYKKILKYKKK